MVRRIIKLKEYWYSFIVRKDWVKYVTDYINDNKVPGTTTSLRGDGDNVLVDISFLNTRIHPYIRTLERQFDGVNIESIKRERMTEAA